MSSHSLNKLITPAAYLVVIAMIAIAVWFGRPYWRPLLSSAELPDPAADSPAMPAIPKVDQPKVLELNAQARSNLNLKAAPIKVQTYWRTLEIPGVIEDRPGLTDRGITAALAGVVTQVHAFEGDIVRPGEKLFTIRLVSEYLQQSQTDLFKATREIEILNQEVQRIRGLIADGSLPGKRGLELEQQISRQNAKVDAYRQDLMSRGLSEDQVNQIQRGEFLATLDITAPAAAIASDSKTDAASKLLESDPSLNAQDFFEIQKLKVELGQQVKSGEALAVLANHYSLYIKGHAFKKEASRLAKAAEEGWNVDVRFTQDVPEDWPAMEHLFQIRHLANTTNPNSRTFDFFIPIENQARTYDKEGRLFVVWRYRPGQQVHILLPVEEIKDVLVLPAEAVVFEGPQAFVFQQNGNLFNRIPVKVLHRDRSNVVFANDGSISPGFYLATSAAASLNRILKSQSASGMKPGFHMHADGTVHGAH